MNEIKSRDDFIAFLRELRRNYLENFSSWENKDIGTFLEAMATWTEDMDGFYANQGLIVPEKTDWKIFADILMGGKLYE